MCKTSLLISVILVASTIINVVSDTSQESELKIFELRKGNISVKLTNWGATVVSLFLPDRHGKLADVVLGFDNLDDYKNDKAYFGAIVGRVANRIGGAEFTLNGTTYKLVANEGNNTLHGGKRGFSDVFWKVRTYKPNVQSPYITFSYSSFDGEQGFPGALSVYITYALINGQKLSVTMKAHAKNKPTPVNLAQHTYWNLGGHNSGNILSNTVQLFASKITLVDNALIPTGKIVPVKGTPYDFLQPHNIGSRIHQLPHGYDINYVIDEPAGHRNMKKVALVHEAKSGRVMELWTNEPGVQFYTSNMLEKVKGKGGYVYQKYAALCLETQGFPDAVNHPNFPSQIVTPRKPYKHFMLHKFSVK